MPGGVFKHVLMQRNLFSELDVVSRNFINNGCMIYIFFQIMKEKHLRSRSQEPYC